MATITRESLLTLEAYDKQRDALRAEAMHRKNHRRVFVGPNVTLQFEDETTIRYQIQEMLRIEKTFDEEGINDELEAYNPLVPDGDNWKATMMIEFPDVDERREKLVELRDIENRCYVQVGANSRSYAIADEDLPRANDEKTSAVHFLRFQLDADSIAAIRQGEPVAIGIDLPAYSYRIDELAPETQSMLSEDLR